MNNERSIVTARPRLRALSPRTTDRQTRASTASSFSGRSIASIPSSKTTKVTSSRTNRRSSGNAGTFKFEEECIVCFGEVSNGQSKVSCFECEDFLSRYNKHVDKSNGSGKWYSTNQPSVRQAPRLTYRTSNGNSSVPTITSPRSSVRSPSSVSRSLRVPRLASSPRLSTSSTSNFRASSPRLSTSGTSNFRDSSPRLSTSSTSNFRASSPSTRVPRVPSTLSESVTRTSSVRVPSVSSTSRRSVV